MAPRVTVVVMAFNEAASLEALVREIHGTLGQLDQTHEILIVDDGSTDGTAEIADRLAREVSGLWVIHHAANEGLGGVYRTGFKAARGDLVTFFPADGQFPTSIITRFVPLIEEQDMVLGYLPQEGRSLLGRVLPRAERVLYRVMLGPLPVFEGILMFRRKILQGLPLTSTGRGWAVLMEMIIRASRSGCRIRSVPTEICPRISGSSKVRNLRTIWSNFWQVVALRRHL